MTIVALDCKAIPPEDVARWFWDHRARDFRDALQSRNSARMFEAARDLERISKALPPSPGERLQAVYCGNCGSVRRPWLPIGAAYVTECPVCRSRTAFYMKGTAAELDSIFRSY